jgi:hypothetical protein
MNRVTAKVDKPLVGANLQAHLDGLRDQMRKAAENLEFEEAARLRDEVKRLEAVELAVADDPLARQSAVEAAWTVEPSARRLASQPAAAPIRIRRISAVIPIASRKASMVGLRQVSMPDQRGQRPIGFHRPALGRAKCRP